MNKNDRVTLTISAMSADGLGIGRSEDNIAVFVPGAAIGDVVEVIIVKVLKNYCFGKIVSFIEQSGDRTEPDCAVFSRCGGCCYRHIRYDAELKVKQRRVADAIKRIGGLDVEVRAIIGADSRDHYRNKAQFPVGKDKSGKAQCGFYALHSHRIVPCTDCRLQPKEFSDILDETIDFVNECRIPVYDEETHSGILRHIFLRRTMSGDVAVCLVINADRLPKEMEKAYVDRIRSRFAFVKTVVLNINKKQTGVILGAKNRILYGDGYLTDTICGIRIRISPLSFYQVNRDMAERLYKIAAEAAEARGKTVIDLYCGTGTIGLSMAGIAKEVIGVEIVESAVKDARRNAEQNGINNATFLCADAAEAAKKLGAKGVRPDVVILDPPRKGAEKSLIETIAEQFAAPTVVYISCDPATLARDLAVFDSLGYKTLSVQPVDMFPSTAHVETVVLLSKGEIDSKKIRVEFSLEDMDTSGFQQGATYEQIKGRVLEQTGLKVSSLYISQIKRKCGLEVGQSYNLSKKENAKQPQCPPEKEKAIREAMKYFGMI
ncbi:MAG: 23S rRNA (uracil(1939)-C(5))-methyltransferase RlmD [Acutalibacteraceae bacterium]